MYHYRYDIIASSRAAYLREVLAAYGPVVFTDVDTVWLADPRPFFTGIYMYTC